MREPSWSLVPTAKCGLSSVAPCHHSTLSAPPPPRLVGLYSNFALRTAPRRRSRASGSPSARSGRARPSCARRRGGRACRPSPLRSDLAVLARPSRYSSTLDRTCPNGAPSQSPRRPAPIKENRFARRGQRARAWCRQERLPRRSNGQGECVRSSNQLETFDTSLPHTVSSVHPSAANSEARSGASPTEKNSSSCGGLTGVPASMAWAWPR